MTGRWRRVAARLIRRTPRPRAPCASPTRGSAALLTMIGGGVALLVALVLVVTVADLALTRGQAQLAADAAALAAMQVPLGDAAAVAEDIAARNAARVVDCCGPRVDRRQVEVAVGPRSALLAMVVPQVRAAAAAAAVPGAGAAWPGSAQDAATEEGGPRVWPADGPLTSGFGNRVHPITGISRLHAGIDIAAAAGNPVRSAAAGVVVAAGDRGGYGLTIDIDHGGVITRSAHLSRVFVTVGQRVDVGQGIGAVGSTGASTGPHLHFEVRTGAGPVDPRTWLPNPDV